MQFSIFCKLSLEISFPITWCLYDWVFFSCFGIVFQNSNKKTFILRRWSSTITRVVIEPDIEGATCWYWVGHKCLHWTRFCLSKCYVCNTFVCNKVLIDHFQYMTIQCEWQVILTNSEYNDFDMWVSLVCKMPCRIFGISYCDTMKPIRCLNSSLCDIIACRLVF